MGIGIIKGRVIGANRDGDSSRIILQVEMEAEDVRTVELMSEAGEDTNPGNGCRVVVIDVPGYKIGIAVTDDLTPEVDPGEKELYSTDSPVTEKKARTKWTSGGDIISDADGGAKLELLHDGDAVFHDGTESALKYADLDTGLQNLVTLVNTELGKISTAIGTLATALGITPNPYIATPVTLDISAAEVPEVKLP